MRTADWTDSLGRTWRSLLPDDAAPDTSPELGILIGPLDTSSLNLPEPIAVKLHNQLHSRGLWSWKDIQHRRQDVVGAVLAALGAPIDQIVNLYYADWQQAQQEQELSKPVTKPKPTLSRRPSSVLQKPR